MKKTTIIEIITVLYVILFLYAGINKLMEYSVFEGEIAASPVLAPISNLIAIGVPIVEFLTVLLLIVPRWRLKGLYTAFASMSSFTIYIILLLNFSKDIPCSCGGILAEMPWAHHIIFNIIFISFSLIGVVYETRTKNTTKNERYLIKKENYQVKTDGF